MVSQLTVESIEEREDHYHVHFRDSETFDELVSPDWAVDLADGEVPGADVRMGEDGSGDWLVQSVLIPVDLVDSGDDASRRALEVVTAISERDQPD
jgi:hypothetical protein